MPPVRRQRAPQSKAATLIVAFPPLRLEINEADRAVLTLKTQARKLEQQRTRVGTHHYMGALYGCWPRLECLLCRGAIMDLCMPACPEATAYGVEICLHAVSCL